MRIVVCIKQVGVLEGEPKFSSAGRSIDPSTIEWDLNEWDASAIEQALRIRDAFAESRGAEVVVMSAGPKRVEDALRRALAMGADRAWRISVDDLESLDALAVARICAGSIAAEEPDLVLAGAQSSDFGQASTGVAISQLLGFARLTMVIDLEYDSLSRTFLASRELEGGLCEVVELDAPALISIQTGRHRPRYATLRAIRQAAQKELAVLAAPREPVMPGCEIRRLFAPSHDSNVQLFQGSAKDIALEISQVIKKRLP